MADTKRALKNNRVVLALTKSTARVIRNGERKRDSYSIGMWLSVAVDALRKIKKC